MNATPLILSHDGSVDDVMALLATTCFQATDLRAVIVTDGDCHAEAAARVSLRVLALAGRTDVPVAISSVRPVHPFPPAWRLDSLRIDKMPILNRPDLALRQIDPYDGAELMATTLEASGAPVTILEIGPLSTVARLLHQRPDLVARIERVIWMGGAFEARGNVSPGDAPTHDGSAEWNAFWDPEAVQAVLRSGVPLVICPLDLTDTVPVTDRLMERLARHRTHWRADLAGQCYALNAWRDYQVWDLLTAAYVDRPGLFRTREARVAVATSGPSSGRTIEAEDDGGDGTKATILTAVDHDRFWDWAAVMFHAIDEVADA